MFVNGFARQGPNSIIVNSEDNGRKPLCGKALRRARSEECIEATVDFSTCDSDPQSLRTKSIPSTHDALSGRSTFVDSENYDASVSGSEHHSRPTPAASAWSLLSAASTSTSSFYPAFAQDDNNRSSFKSSQLRRSQAYGIVKDLKGINDGQEFIKQSSKLRTDVEENSRAHRSEENFKSYTALSSQVDLLCKALEEKEKQLRMANDGLEKKDKQISKLNERIAVLEKNSERHLKVAESIREEAKRDRQKLRDVAKMRDELLLRNASLCHQMEYEKREWSIERERLAMELSDVNRELHLQKMLLNSESISQIVERWESKVFELEGMVSDRDSAIRAQQQRISELNQALQNVMNGEQTASSDSLSTQTSSALSCSPHLAYIKHILLQYFTGGHLLNEQLRALFTALHFTDEEELAVLQNLRRRIPRS